MKFRKKPVVVEAMEYNGENGVDISRWSDGRVASLIDGGPPLCPTLEGPLTVSVGDFVIRGIKGEFYPCKPDIFWATYDVELPS